MISNLICKCKNYPITANWLAQKKIQCFSDHVQGQIYQLQQEFLKIGPVVFSNSFAHTHNPYCFIIQTLLLMTSVTIIEMLKRKYLKNLHIQYPVI